MVVLLSRGALRFQARSRLTCSRPASEATSSGNSVVAIGAGRDPESEEHGHPLGAVGPGPVPAVDEPGRPGDGRQPWALDRDRLDQPGEGRRAFRQGSGHTFAEILEAADYRASRCPRFAIPKRIKATVAVKRTDVESQNVAAVLPGTDPVLKGEYVVFSAHLDHIGVGKPINGDPIYNGAMDNASGVAAMLDVAAMLKESGAKLRRSVLFVAVTGEEKGLLGSRFFANFPTVDPKSIVADINTDMFLPLYPMKRLTIYGLDESDLGDDASIIAKSLDVAPEPDPEPKRNIFIRSDQYSFIRRGIPSIALKVGFAKGSPEEQLSKKWLTEQPCAAHPTTSSSRSNKAATPAAFDALVAKLLERVANRDQKPRWKDSYFFQQALRGLTDADLRRGTKNCPLGGLKGADAQAGEGPPKAKEGLHRRG